MKNLLKTALAFATTAIMFSSCKKDDVVAPQMQKITTCYDSTAILNLTIKPEEWKFNPNEQCWDWIRNNQISLGADCFETYTSWGVNDSSEISNAESAFNLYYPVFDFDVRYSDPDWSISVKYKNTKPEKDSSIPPAPTYELTIGISYSMHVKH